MKPFYLKWTVEGVPELSRRLFMYRRKVKDFTEPLFKASRLILQDVEEQFETEGGLSEGGWQPLQKATVRQRIREGYGAGPILQRTGDLRRSFKGDVTKKRAVITSHGVDYYKYHQSKKPRTTKLPRRPMLLLVERTRENIVQVFNDFLKFD